MSLEQVRSYGTEGRKGNPAAEVPASDNIFEYIIFRGSDVKDLRVEAPGATREQLPAPRLQDPAIVSVRLFSSDLYRQRTKGLQRLFVLSVGWSTRHPICT